MKTYTFWLNKFNHTVEIVSNNKWDAIEIICKAYGLNHDADIKCLDVRGNV